VQQRAPKAYVPGVALLAALLVGCTGGSGLGDAAADSKPGGSDTPVAAPGKYATLPEPCGTVDRGMLQQLLPSMTELTMEQQEKAYEGTATLTYDSDRRVGCRWKLDSADGTRHLHLDFERVVSYDGAVSDDDRAAELYAEQATDAGIPTASASATTGTADPEATDGSTQSPEDAASGTADPESSASSNSTASPSGSGSGSASSSPSPSTDGLESRILENLGDSAFLDDTLSESDSTARTRTVTVVFRTSNVIVTIEYAEQAGRVTDVPDSQELQDNALALADTLAEQFA
jgi:hypothetical protein